jgi:GTPase
VYVDGRVQQTEHSSDGTGIKARVLEALAASLRDFSVT